MKKPRKYREDFHWDEHARDSVPFLVFVALLTLTLTIIFSVTHA